jgi:PKD domain-containing protein
VRNQRFIVIIVSLGLIVACGGSGGSSSGTSTPSAPTSPTPPTTPVNRAPTITSLNFAPAFGIAQLTTFNFNGSASDPDGDAMTYSWDVAGNPFSGTAGSILFSGGGNGTARFTVTDSKGATASDARSFVVGTATGQWRGTFGSWVFTSNLTQNAGFIVGDYSDQLGPGRLDPAVANTIDANGNVKLRYKQAIFSDFTFTGTMDSTGRRISGVVNGSGYSNAPFTMTK